MIPTWLRDLFLGKRELPASVTIRRAGLGDARDIMLIERMCFPDPWTLFEFKEHLKENWRTCYLAEYRPKGPEDKREPRLVGFALASPDEAAACELWLDNLAIHPRFRRQGIGMALTSKVIGAARRFEANQLRWMVHERNDDGIAFAHALGATCHIKHSPYPHWEGDGYEFTLDLKRAAATIAERVRTG